MKLLLSALLLVTLAVMATPQTIKELVQECKKTVPISEELETSFLELKFPPEERTTHCLMNCIGEMMKVLNNETGINLAVIKTMLKDLEPAGEISEEQVKCIEQAGKQEEEDDNATNDECMMAFKTYQCFEKEFLALLKKEQGE